MKKTILNLRIFILFSALITIGVCAAQDRIAVIENPFVKLLDPVDGSIVDPSFIDLTPLNPTTPKAILQVLEEIWITDQVEDRIDRFDLFGDYIGTISGGLDNIRGLEIVSNEVWVTNAGNNNGAPGNSIVRFDFAGNNLGFFSTSGTDSVFDIIDVGGEVYMSYIGGESKIERRDYSGVVLGNVVGEGVVNFIQQMEVNTANNSVYAAVFSVTGSNSSGLYEFAISDGSILNYWNEGNLRGIAILENTNVLVSNAGGVSILDPSSGVSTQITTNSSQYFGRLTLTPCTAPPQPTGDASQTFPSGATLEDIVVSPTDVSWFATEADAMSGANPLPLSTVLVDGTTYYAVTIEANCLSDFLAVTVNITLGVEDFDLNALVMYPNPARTTVHIEHTDTFNQVRVFNLLGQEVLRESVNTNILTIDVSELPTALYSIVIDFESYQHSVKLLKLN